MIYLIYLSEVCIVSHGHALRQGHTPPSFSEVLLVQGGLNLTKKKKNRTKQTHPTKNDFENNIQAQSRVWVTCHTNNRTRLLQYERWGTAVSLFVQPLYFCPRGRDFHPRNYPTSTIASSVCVFFSTIVFFPVTKLGHGDWFIIGLLLLYLRFFFFTSCLGEIYY